MSEALARDGDISASNTWTVETLRDYFLGLIASNDRRYSEEVGNLREMIRLMDARYGERAEAQQRAIEVAFTAQQTGLNAALLAQKEAIATALVAAEKAVNAALVSSAQAVQKAETAAERRFDSVNEFRQTLSDQQRTLMPRAEIEVMMRAMNEKIDLLSSSYRDHQAKATGMSAGWSMAIAAVGLISLVVSIIMVFWRKG